MQNETLMNVVKANKLFSNASPEHIEVLDEKFFHWKEFGTGEVVISQLQPSERIYLIVEGHARVIQNDKNGNPTEVGRLSVNDFFGEIGVMLNSFHNATVEAITSLKALEVSSYGFFQILEIVPVVRENVFKNILNIVFDMNENIVHQVMKGNLLSEMYLAINHQKRELEKINQVLMEANRDLQDKNEILFEMATMDSLTKVFNRAHVLDRLNREYQMLERYNHELSIIMFDIDEFKAVNDNYGHLTGDFVLKQIAHLIKNNLRKVDVFGRYGGDEFLVILPNIGIEQAHFVAEKLRRAVADTPIGTDASNIYITLSLGVTNRSTGMPKNPDEMLKHADMALYRAKELGKNRSITYRDLLDNLQVK